MSCQLFTTHTSPAGPIARSVCIWSPPPTYPPGGEIWSPVLKPGGQFSVRTPQSSVIGLLGIAKLEIQTLSLPSTTAAQGPGRPPPVNGEPRYCEPSGRSKVTLPSLPFCSDMPEGASPAPKSSNFSGLSPGAEKPVRFTVEQNSLIHRLSLNWGSIRATRLESRALLPERNSN